ncbi:hypothetical protein P3583_09555 [Vibrio parahaemolyticus]|uniref:hypothetical protein n=1 Tax=Vibrio antiquarius (strain Ex25) TaxID=150340 RepID=UPI0023ED0A0E|nr:hypothetical protein [Vibrio antiquarius]MCR9628861.1 hypothetical protein [Vibrio antiquarius]MCR9632894.1 hypothetical protein [Vibrio antiquarius]MDF4987838.1 hypothetical protein [Vibrio parahaemolyticus]MDF5385365.1 hypothetical protein [Vibrio parahaemolyticus]
MRSIGMLALAFIAASSSLKAEAPDVYLACQKSLESAKGYASSNNMNELISLRTQYASSRNYSEFAALFDSDITTLVDAIMKAQGVSRSEGEELFFRTLKPYHIERVQIAIDSKRQGDEVGYWNDIYKSCVEKSKAYLLTNPH